MSNFYRAGIIILFVGILFPNFGLAEFGGRFNMSAFGAFPDNDDMDNRSIISTSMRFNWIDDKDGLWSFHSNFRIKEELETEKDGIRAQVWDLRLDYGLDQEFVAGSIGMCNLVEVSGIGSILGAQLQINPLDWLTFGVFGGANPIVEEGITDVDGTRFGGYARIGEGYMKQAGIAFLRISDIDDQEEDQEYIEFDTRYMFGRIFNFYQAGELDLNDPEDSVRLSYYYGRVQSQPSDLVRISLAYQQYYQIPNLEFQDQVEQDDGDQDYYQVPGADSKTWSVTPKLTLMFARYWRAYIRYQYRETDFFGGDTWHRYQGGVACTNLFNSGMYASGSIVVYKRDNGKDTEALRMSISQDAGPVNLTLGYAGDRYLYGENSFSHTPVDSTHRATLSAFYRLSSNMSVLFDYEWIFGDEDEHQVLMNFNYRF